MPKRHRKYIWRQARPGSAGKLVRSPDLLAAMGALLLRGGREGNGAAYKGDEREGREGRNSPQSQDEWNKTLTGLDVL